MKVMIFVVGCGECMWLIILYMFKLLIEVVGVLLIECQLLVLCQVGVDDWVINYVWFGEQIEVYFGDGLCLGGWIVYFLEGELLEIGGGIFCVLLLFGEQLFLLFNGDVWSDFDYFWLYFVDGDLVYLVLVDNLVYYFVGDFYLDVGGWVGEICEVGGNFIYSGIVVLYFVLFEGCQLGVFKLVLLLCKVIVVGWVSGEYYCGQWVDVGIYECLVEVE